MVKPFNQLTPAQAEALALLMEECGEVVQACAKILRHGLESYHPDGDGHTDNRDDLEKEIGDLRAAILIAAKQKLIRISEIPGLQRDKLERVGDYLHHARVP